MLFDESASYEEMLARGIELSGEDQHFFIEGRIDDLRRHLPPDCVPRRILDFGCGVGHTAAKLAVAFPAAEIVGVDQSRNALARAASEYRSDRVTFWHSRDGWDREPFDLCYVNGVFHHIVPAERPAAIGKIHGALRPRGCLALFENNPLNPGTRLVMRRIPFDRDAIPLYPWQTRKLVVAGGFQPSIPTRYLFFFPRPLRGLRFAEAWLDRFPLGAQYYVLATKH